VLEAVDAGLDAVICSPATLTGPHDFEPSMLGSALIDLYRGKIPILLDVVCDYADVRDVAAAMIRAMTDGRTGERYLLSGEVLDMLELTAILRELTGRAMPKHSLPLWVGWVALPFAVALGAVTGNPPVFSAGVTAWSCTTRLRPSWVFDRDRCESHCPTRSRGFARAV
jgi:dihydroflavonol-4-reductase